jgi:hypothetical protein
MSGAPLAVREGQSGLFMVLQLGVHELEAQLNSEIEEKLEKRNAPITSDRAYDIREEVDAYVYNLRRDDINFGKFYDRYFSNDNFVYVAD